MDKRKGKNVEGLGILKTAERERNGEFVKILMIVRISGIVKIKWQPISHCGAQVSIHIVGIRAQNAT